MVGEVTALAHELRDDAVEAAALEAKALRGCTGRVPLGRERKRRLIKNKPTEDSLVIQWLRFHASKEGAQVQSLVGGTEIPHASGAWSKPKQ